VAGFSGFADNPVINSSCPKWSGFFLTFEIDLEDYFLMDYDFKGDDIQVCC